MVDRKLAGMRKDYETGGLTRAMVDADPIRHFDLWMDEAVEAGMPQPNAMILATADERGRPSARAVLLKGYSESGFVFYTNLESRKARELDANPWAALCIVWLDMHRQVRVEGPVQRLDERTSDEYFASRPRDARIAAIASPQSEVIEDRAGLEAMVAGFGAEYGEGEVPRPGYWGGLSVRPEIIEFWQGRRDRLHDRIVFVAEGEGWRLERLAP